MLRLIQNEIIKIYRQHSWKIITLIILIVAVAVPPIMRSMIPEYNLPEGSCDPYEYYKSQYESAAEGSAEKGYYKTAMENEQFFSENSIDRSSWQSNYVFNYENERYNLKAFELLEEGCDIHEVAEYFVSTIQIYYDENEEEQIEIRCPEGSDYDSGAYYYNAVPYDEKDLSYYIESEKETIKEIEKLLTADKSEFADIKIKETEERLEEEKAILAVEEEKYKNSGEGFYSYDIAKCRCETLEIIIQCWEAFKECDKENEGWIYEEIYSEMETILSHADYFAIKGRENFDDGKYTVAFGGNLSLSFNTYEKYLKQYAEPKREDYTLAAKTVLYSIENQIPINPDRASVKTWFEYSVNIDVYTVMFFCIFLASVIMSSEYSSGAIRLLVIRPRARWKLLLSKLLTVAIFGVGMLIVSTLLSLISTVIVFGWGDLSIPYLEAFAGKITHVQPLLYTFGNALTNSLSMFCIAALAFLLSLLIKKGVISVAISILLFAFGNMAANIFWYTLAYIPFLRYTIVPYFMNLGEIRYTAFQRVLDLRAFSVDYGLALESGMIITLLTAVVMLFLSFTVFDKQQITS